MIGAFRVFAAALGVAGTLLPVPGRAERLVVSLSANEIAIGTNYTGTRLAFFGVVERDGTPAGPPEPFGIVATVRGPREVLTVRRKEQAGPVWINRGQRKFAAVPGILQVLSTGPLASFGDEAFRARYQLGIPNIAAGPEYATLPVEGSGLYRDALVRLKRRDGLWSQDERGVTFVTPTFFRGAIALPAVAPVGNYEVEIALVSGDRLLSRQVASFEVVKSGSEEQMATAAQENGLAYGLFVAGLALGFGWLASVVFRRD